MRLRRESGGALTSTSRRRAGCGYYIIFLCSGSIPAGRLPVTCLPTVLSFFGLILEYSAAGLHRHLRGRALLWLAMLSRGSAPPSPGAGSSSPSVRIAKGPGVALSSLRQAGARGARAAPARLASHLPWLDAWTDGGRLGGGGDDGAS